MSITWSAGVNTRAVRRFIRQMRENGSRPRGFQLYRRGETVSAVFPPFRPDEGMHLYSLSKSFTSVCVGIAEDRGLLSTDERMLDIFPDLAPEHVSENLSEMTLGDVLSMQSGHAVCHLDQMRFSENAVRTFLAMPVVYKPGTTFVYSTGGTAVCGAAVARRSGMSLRAFMNQNLFEPLGIADRKPLCCADGTHCGGTGLFISQDELFKFGKLLLGGGVYEGKRIVSESYLRRATSPIADNSANGTHDWTVGYGYQFWRNDRAGFRGDGAYGQYMVVLPEQDTVFILQECTDRLQEVLDDVFELLDGVCIPDASEGTELEEDVRSFYAVQPSALPKEQVYELEDNPADIRSVLVLADGRDVLIRFATAYGEQTIRAGNGCWIESHPMLRNCKPGLIALDPHFGWIENLHVRSSFRVEDGELTVTCKHIDTPHTQWFRFAPEGIYQTADGGLKPEAGFFKRV